MSYTIISFKNLDKMESFLCSSLRSLKRLNRYIFIIDERVGISKNEIYLVYIYYN